MIPTGKVSDSISRKCEIGFAHYLRQYAPVPHVQIGRRGGEPQFPLLLVTATSSQKNPDFLPQDGNYLVELQVDLYWEATEGSSRPLDLDAKAGEIACAMAQLADVQTFLNLAQTGVDARPVTEFHVDQVDLIGSRPDTQEGSWLESQTYTVTCVAADQTFAVAAAAPVVEIAGNLLLETGDLLLLETGDNLTFE